MLYGGGGEGRGEGSGVHLLMRACRCPVWERAVLRARVPEGALEGA